MPVALFMDVHVHAAVTEQLRRRGVDVLTAQDDHSVSLSDEKLLERANALSRLLFTNDIRFRALAETWQSQRKHFSGLVWAHPMRVTIGRMVMDLELIAQGSEPADWINVVERLPL